MILGCFLTRALQPVTLVEKSIHRERPGGLDLLNNSHCASPVSTEVTGNLITQPAQIQLVRATLQVTPRQMYSALLSEPPGFLLRPDFSFNGIKHRERMKIFWLLQLVCLAMMVYTVLVCIQVVPMERDPLCWGSCWWVRMLPASSFTLNPSRCSSKMCAQNPRARGHPTTTHITSSSRKAL